MSQADPQAVLARAERLLETKREERRREFPHEVNKVASACAKAGVYAGSAHRERAHQICTAELHTRTSAAVDSVLEAHGALSASPSGAHRRACKDWIAACIAAEAGELEQHLQWPYPSTPNSLYDDLKAATQSERDGAFARIDNAFDRLGREVVERAWRWLIRPWISLRLLLAGQFWRSP
jgi:hypothetical protein